MRIGLAGTMSVGKTTLAKALGELDQFKDHNVQTERSKYLRDLGIPLNTDSTLNGQFVFLAERATELLYPNIITDRTIWDVCAFTLGSKSIEEFAKRAFVDAAMFLRNNYDLVIGYINKLEKSKYGVLEIINRKLVSIKEKPNFNIDISAGIYVLKNNNVIRKLPKKFLTMPDLIKMFIKKKLKIGVYEIKEYWKGIENIENLHEVSRKNK